MTETELLDFFYYYKYKIVKKEKKRIIITFEESYLTNKVTKTGYYFFHLS